MSIITVCYNSAATLEQTIVSVLNQSYTDIEYIIIDGASTDRTPEIISKYKDRISHVVSEPDKGIYDAMNKGLRLATGDIIGILNSDDIYFGNHIVAQIVKNFDDKTDAVCSDVEIFEGAPENVKRYYSCTRWKPWMFRLGHQPPHPGFFARSECYEKWGVFDTQFKLAADFDLLFRFIYKNKIRVKYISFVSVSMRSGGASQTFGNIVKSNREVNRSIKQQGYFSSIILVWMKYFIKIFQFA